MAIIEKAGRREGDLEIQDAAAWILRVGVVSSVAVMLLGLALSLGQGGLSVARMEGERFSGDFFGIVRGSLSGDGLALVELGISLLVLTPIVRVATSAVLFAWAERDWFYTVVTVLVLGLTLTSLLILR